MSNKPLMTENEMLQRSPILQRFGEQKPSYGPGNMMICRECVEKRKQDIEHQLAEEVAKRSIPSVMVDGVNEWQTVIDLLELWEAKYGK